MLAGLIKLNNIASYFSEIKMEAYIEQLTSLKTHITQLQEDFGEFENLNELHEKVLLCICIYKLFYIITFTILDITMTRFQVNHQRAQLLEATRQNGELAELLQKKEEELEQFSATLAEQDRCIEQREGEIKILSEKEEEQSNIIKILRNNLALRSDSDSNVSYTTTYCLVYFKLYLVTNKTHVST